MNDQRVDLLFISAHADDTELSCGGTIAKAVKEGLRVGMVDLTRSEMGTVSPLKLTRLMRHDETQRRQLGSQDPSASPHVSASPISPSKV